MSSSNFHQITDEKSHNEMISIFTPEPEKSTYYLKKEIEFSLDEQQLSFLGEIGDGLTDLCLQIRLPNLKFVPGYQGRWKPWIASLILVTANLFQEKTPFDQLTGESLKAHRNLFVMESQHSTLEKLEETNQTPSDELKAKNLLVSLPFSFAERPSTFLQLFRCPEKLFVIDFTFERDLSKLLDVFECIYYDSGELKSQELVDFDSEYFTLMSEIEIDTVRATVIANLSSEDKENLKRHRNREIVNITEQSTTDFVGKECAFLINERSEKLAYYSLVWMANQKISASSLYHGREQQFKDAPKELTQNYWPSKYFRCCPRKDSEVHGWTSSFYICDPGPKPAIVFDARAQLKLVFEEALPTRAVLIRFTQIVYVWKGELLVPE